MQTLYSLEKSVVNLEKQFRLRAGLLAICHVEGAFTISLHDLYRRSYDLSTVWLGYVYSEKPLELRNHIASPMYLKKTYIKVNLYVFFKGLPFILHPTSASISRDAMQVHNEPKIVKLGLGGKKRGRKVWIYDRWNLTICEYSISKNVRGVR